EDADLKEEAAQQAAQSKGGNDACCAADAREQEALADNSDDDLPALRAEGEAQADFANAPTDDVSDEAVNADCADDERERSEAEQQDGKGARRGDGRGDNFIERADAGDGNE